MKTTAATATSIALPSRKELRTALLAFSEKSWLHRCWYGCKLRGFLSLAMMLATKA
jgi:hypothetical protein